MNWEEIKTVLILQPENPDGDSVASALALEEILGELDKEVIIYSYVHIPDYLSYISGQDRITHEFPNKFDLTVIVDTVSGSLLEKTLKNERLVAINAKPVLVIDCHPVENNLPLPDAVLYQGEGNVIATGEIIVQLAEENNWKINSTAATHIVESILADTLGLNTEAVSGQTLRTVAQMLDLGAQMSEIDTRRREVMQKSPEIVSYKGSLLQRIEYLIDGKLAIIHIPWDEIEKYSPYYNPSMLALEELRNTHGVELAVALKSYPDGKITGKIRANNKPLAGELAAHFGGGGHDYAAGFKTNEWKFDDLKNELLRVCVTIFESC